MHLSKLSSQGLFQGAACACCMGLVRLPLGSGKPLKLVRGAKPSILWSPWTDWLFFTPSYSNQLVLRLVNACCFRCDDIPDYPSYTPVSISPQRPHDNQQPSTIRNQQSTAGRFVILASLHHFTSPHHHTPIISILISFQLLSCHLCIFCHSFCSFFGLERTTSAMAVHQPRVSYGFIMRMRMVNPTQRPTTFTWVNPWCTAPTSWFPNDAHGNHTGNPWATALHPSPETVRFLRPAAVHIFAINRYNTSQTWEMSGEFGRNWWTCLRLMVVPGCGWWQVVLVCEFLQVLTWQVPSACGTSHPMCILVSSGPCGHGISNLFFVFGYAFSGHIEFLWMHHCRYPSRKQWQSVVWLWRICPYWSISGWIAEMASPTAFADIHKGLVASV